MVIDPKALQHIFNSGYNFPKSREADHVTTTLFGQGLVAVAGGVFLPIPILRNAPLIRLLCNRTATSTPKANSEPCILGISTAAIVTSFARYGSQGS